MRIITGSKYNDHTDPLFKSSCILKVKDMYEYKLATYMYLMNAGVLPKELMKMLTTNNEIHNHNTRNKYNPHIFNSGELILRQKLSDIKVLYFGINIHYK